MAATSPHSSVSPSSSSANSSPTLLSAPQLLENISPPPPNPPPNPPLNLVLSPCAACKILRRRCAKNCVLAPYFPPTEPLKFTTAHKVFGASNIIKMLQELGEDQRADAVNSMVYEGNARIRDPIYGCAGAICQLQNQISELQAELAKAKAEMLNLQCQNQNLVSMICMTSPHHEEEMVTDNNNNNYDQFPFDNTNVLLQDVNFYDAWEWEPLWT